MTDGVLFGAPAPRVFTIDSGRPFLVDLARALLNAFPDPLALSEVELFLPNRRAAQSLGESFLNAADGRAVLLPRIRPLGDDEGDAAIDEGADADADAPAGPLAAFERRLVLARLVAAAGGEGRPWNAGVAGALGAADALGELLDSLYTEEIDASRIAGACPRQFAEHWTRTLDFVGVVADAWPRYLENRGSMDAAALRATRIGARARRFAASPPSGPVIVAGTTASAPSVRRLAAAVARLRRGAVVLPGLDRALAGDRRAWEAVDDGHPQFGLKLLLESLGLDARAVRAWPGSGEPSPRTRLLSVALRPADATDDWRDRLGEATAADAGLFAAVDGLSLVEAADEAEEAMAIAIALRESLEDVRATAFLVTPDRGLARRVAMALRRWNVNIDDSAGTPLAETACGAFLRLTARAALAPDDPSAALAALRHPLIGLSLRADRRTKAVDAFDRACRGVAPAAEAGGLKALVARSGRVEAIETLAALTPPDVFRGADKRLIVEMIAAHLGYVETLAATDEEHGAARVWRGRDGALARKLTQDAMAAGEALGEARPSEYPAILDALIAGAVVRTPARDARAAILGPLEARLQSADLVILGGLNEGVWPRASEADPFLAPAIRQSLGLPSTERSIGLSAHDFAQAASAPRVLLTRSKKSGGAPAKPSRWIVRLVNLLAAAGALSRVDRTERYAALAASLDEAGPPRPASPPSPRPPADARPRRLAVTSIETFLRDPYAVYARNILRLKKLPPPGAKFADRDLGTLMHAVFARFFRDGIDPDADEAPARFAALVEDEAPRFGMSRAQRALFEAQLAAAGDAFLAAERERRLSGVQALAEEPGEATLSLPSGPFSLVATADRIDRLNNGGCAVFDYKKTPPTLQQMRSFRVQLQLTGVIAEAGGFGTLGAADVRRLSYVEAAPRSGVAAERTLEGDEARRAVDEARRGAVEWLERYAQADMPYLSQPRPQFAADEGDYDLLARRREWTAVSKE